MISASIVRDSTAERAHWKKELCCLCGAPSLRLACTNPPESEVNLSSMTNSLQTGLVLCGDGGSTLTLAILVFVYKGFLVQTKEEKTRFARVLWFNFSTARGSRFRKRSQILPTLWKLSSDSNYFIVWQEKYTDGFQHNVHQHGTKCD